MSIRGSWSISDIFTDLAAQPETFTAPGFPENTFAHYGVTKCCNQVIRRLNEDSLLDKVLEHHPGYELVFTGHSLGAALAILIGAKLRSKYRDLKVYGFATPSGMLTREAAKYTEQFAFTVVIGDDCFARISVDDAENLKNSILESLQSCRLPKVRNFLAYLPPLPTFPLLEPLPRFLKLSLNLVFLLKHKLPLSLPCYKITP